MFVEREAFIAKIRFPGNQRSTMEQMIPKIIEAGKHPGTLVADADQAKYWNDKGINFLIGSANRYLMNGAKDFIETTQKILRS